MRVVFVNPPSLLSDTFDLAPPLWVLLLGGIAKRLGFEVAVVDLNLELLAGKLCSSSVRFYEGALKLIGDQVPDIICYSSMGLNSHVALTLAKLINTTSPAITQVVGGPHFSAIAAETLQYYPWIDAVFVGEAEVSFANFLSAELTGADVGSIPGVLRRREVNGGRRVVSSVRELTQPSQVPAPDYQLVDLGRYFTLNPRCLLDFDGARRGCKYACRYCYAPGHFGQGERRPENQRYLQELKMASTVGAKHLFLVSDNFVNHPRETIELCYEIAAARIALTFNCYATLPQLSAECLRALASAGCNAIYVGVDAVHPQTKREWGKSFYRTPGRLIEIIEVCREQGITPTLAFMLDDSGSQFAHNQTQSWEQFETTVHVAFTAAERGANITFNTLTLYPNVPLTNECAWRFVSDNLKARISFDAPEVVHENAFSAEHPELFPFHSTHRDLESQGRLLVSAHLLKTLSRCAPEAVTLIIERGALRALLTELSRDFSPQEFASWTPLQRRQYAVSRVLEII